jgi:hypothetical protein
MQTPNSSIYMLATGVGKILYQQCSMMALGSRLMKPKRMSSTTTTTA